MTTKEKIIYLIWSYDITAVDNFFHKNIGEWLRIQIYWEIRRYYTETRFSITYYIEIPNKPILLYTEEEKKQLLAWIYKVILQRKILR